LTNILVTGADGFIGSNFIKYLYEYGLIEEDDSVFGLYRSYKDSKISPMCLSGIISECTPLLSNLLNFHDLKEKIIRYEIDSIYHFAAQPIVKYAQQDPRPSIMTNVVGTVNLLEASRIADVKQFYLMSSDKVYGDEPDPYTEETNLGNCTGIYSASKSSADILARSYGRIYGIDVKVGRCCNIYGKYDMNFTRLIPGVIKEIITTGKYKVYEPDNNIMTREFIYTDDLSRAILYISLTGTMETYNIGSSEVHSISDVKNTIADILGFGERVEIDTGREFVEIQNQSIDDSRLRNEFDFDNEYSLEEGLSKTIKWYVDYLTGGE